MAYIIMKYDDLMVENLTAFSRVADFSIQEGYPVSMGLVGQSLESDNKLYKNKLKEWIKGGIEIWNHGYVHSSKEFSSEPYERQRQSIWKTQKLMETELGQAAITFGSPHNNSTETTIRALKDTAPEIRNYLFAVDGSSVSDARQLLLRCDMEVTTGRIEADFFRENYEALKDFPYMVIQGHPSFWSEQDFRRNEEIMRYLRDEGNIFVTPHSLPDCGFYKEADVRGEECIKELLEFARMHEKAAIYGAGEIGREMYRFLKAKSVSTAAFIVSDGQEINEQEICSLPVMPLSEISGCIGEYGVIVGMMPKFHMEVEKALQREKADYFCFCDKKRYMYLVHCVRMQLS
jgi:peptidoglycan/xylan/chitin deacetylase (PgdA/CDA1 family)